MTAIAVEPAFEIELWEQAVESHPCQALPDGGATRCEHEAEFTAELICSRCKKTLPHAYLCARHMAMAECGQVGLHAICLFLGFSASVVTSRRITT